MKFIQMEILIFQVHFIPFFQPSAHFFFTQPFLNNELPIKQSVVSSPVYPLTGTLTVNMSVLLLSLASPDESSLVSFV